VAKYTLTPDEISALTIQIPGLTKMSGLSFDGAALTVPDSLADQVAAIIATPNWQDIGAKKILINYAANKADAIKNGGFSFGLGGGVTIFCATDTTTVLELKIANDYSITNPTATQAFPFPSGVINLTATNIQTIYAAVIAFRGSVMTMLSSMVTGVDSGAITTTEQIDAADWPQNP